MQKSFVGLLLLAAVPLSADDDSYVRPSNGARYFNCKDADHISPARELIARNGRTVCAIYFVCDVLPNNETRVIPNAIGRALCAPENCATKSIYACLRDPLAP